MEPENKKLRETIGAPKRKSVASLTMCNSMVSLGFFFISIIVQFFFRSYFIEILGDEVLGLNGTITSIMGFLNIAELGLATAVGFSLYKPISEGDRKTINEIVSLQGWFYRIVSLVVIVSSVIMLFFFPIIFGKAISENHIPLWYAYSTFSVLLINSLLGYIFNYRQILFFSDMKGYKVTLVVRGSLVLKIITQILFILHFKGSPDYAYFSWVVIEALCGVIQTVLLDWVIRRNYPWLRKDLRKGKLLSLKHPEIMKKTKQLFFHKITTFIVLTSTPLIIMAVMKAKDSLSTVAIYQNYYTLYIGVSGILQAIFSGFTPSIGNLKAANIGLDRLEYLFRSLFAVRLWLSMIFCFVIYYFSKDFMLLWVGGERYFSTPALLLFIFFCYLQLVRMFDEFIQAFGMYQDVWAALAEGGLSIGLSLGLGYIFGLEGIFIGMCVSLLIIVHVWKPIFLYRLGFQKSPLRFFLSKLWMFIVMIVIGMGVGTLRTSFYPKTSSWGSLILVGGASVLVYALFSFLIAFFVMPDMKGGFALLKEKILPLLRKTVSSTNAHD